MRAALLLLALAACTKDNDVRLSFGDPCGCRSAFAARTPPANRSSSGR